METLMEPQPVEYLLRLVTLLWLPPVPSLRPSPPKMRLGQTPTWAFPWMQAPVMAPVQAPQPQASETPARGTLARTPVTVVIVGMVEGVETAEMVEAPETQTAGSTVVASSSV